MRYQYSEEDKARMAGLNLRAEKVGYKVHVPNKEKHWGWYYLVAQQSEDEDYEKRIIEICYDLDRVAQSLTLCELRYYTDGKLFGSG